MKPADRTRCRQVVNDLADDIHLWTTTAWETGPYLTRADCLDIADAVLAWIGRLDHNRRRDLIAYRLDELDRYIRATQGREPK